MAKRKHREPEPTLVDANTNANKNVPFGIDPMQLMGLLGGNFDIGNIGNVLSSMNTNGFNFGNLGSLAQMMGLNLDNNFLQGNSNASTNANNLNKNMYSNPSMNNKAYSHKNTNRKNNGGSKLDETNNKTDINKDIDKDITNKDENLEFLMSLRSYVHPDRISFIDKIIELYENGEFKEI